MLNEKKKILFLMKLIPIGGVITVSIVLILLAINGINNYFQTEVKNAEKEITYKTISNAKKSIESIYELVDHIDVRVKKFYKRDVKNIVDLGYTFLQNIYNSNQNYPRDIIIQKIKDNFRNIRFYDDQSGYFFIYDMKGNVVLLPIKPELEGKNLLSFKDITGKYVIQDVIKKLKKKDAIFEEWSFYKPNTQELARKLGYIRYFKPLDIFIGSAVYIDNIEKEIYKRLLHVILKINLVHNSDLLILTKKGKVFYSVDRKLLNKNFADLYKDILTSLHDSKEIKVIKRKDSLLVYTYYAHLDFVIISKIDLKQLHNMILNQKNDIKKIVNVVITQFLTASIIFVVLIIIISIYLTNLIENVFQTYEKELIKEKEKAQKASKIKSEFLANMSHEIRTPLNAMFGFIKILKEKDHDNENQRYLHIIEKSGENLLTIINDILDLSKIEAGKFHIEHIEFNPKAEIEVIHTLFSSKASEKHILLQIKETNLKYNIITDPTRLKQVISNLLSNAIKFTPPKKNITLNVKYDDQKEELFIEVIDEGIGISKDRINTIFEAFSQADTSTTRKYGGTGLGLTISYKLVKLLGGELKVESEEGKGSRFYFTIPAKKGDIAKEIEKDKKPILDEKFDYHILLVEDNIANQMFMKVILNKMGITFDIAKDGLEAVEMFKNNKYDFILMDENMPNMNGIEATKRIRQIEEENGLSYTIIIALTANALEGDEERFLKAGMDFYLSKPLNIEKLKSIFKNIGKI